MTDHADLVARLRALSLTAPGYVTHQHAVQLAREAADALEAFADALTARDADAALVRAVREITANWVVVDEIYRRAGTTPLR